jgi:hypothetical protein
MGSMSLAETRLPIPKSHPVHGFFRRLTERGLSIVGRPEHDLVLYISDMLVRFVHIDSLYRIRDESGLPLEYVTDMIRGVETMEPARRREGFRHAGDFALFVLGFYPERLQSRRRYFAPEDYAEMGRRSYRRAAETEGRDPPAALLRKLSSEFEICAFGLHWVREYTHDAFHQYMLRQFGLT